MMFSTILFTLASAACALAASREPPPTTYLWSANVTSGNISVIGSTPLGNRVVIPIASGEFAGPNLSGKVLPGTIWALYSPEGVNTADAVYVMETTEGDTIMVTEKAHIPNIILLFETASEKYAYLNNVTAYASETPSEGESEIHVYAIGDAFH